MNPIVASLLFSITENIQCQDGVAGCSHERATELNRWAEKSLPAVAPDEDDAVDISRTGSNDLSQISIEELQRILPLPHTSKSKSSNKDFRWEVGVTTSERRMPTLEQSFETIAKAGFENPTLFVDGPMQIPASLEKVESCFRTRRLGAFPNYVASLWELFLRNPFADGFLLIQDDALLPTSPHVREYVEHVTWPVEGPCILSLYCSAKYEKESAGWHRFEGDWVWGAVAFAFSPEAIRVVLNSIRLIEHRAQPDKKGLSQIDVVIGQIATEANIPIFYPSPSLVQHIGTVSTIWENARAVNGRRATQFIGDLLGNPDQKS